MKVLISVDLISIAWKLLWMTGGIVIGVKFQAQIRAMITSVKLFIAKLLVPPTVKP
jgi:hypothetical protein